VDEILRRKRKVGLSKMTFMWILFGFVIGFIVGAVTLFITVNSTFREAVSVDVTKEVFSKAEEVCLEYGVTLKKIVAYYDKDVFYCGDSKIIAKKDRSQNMWVSFELVKSEKN